MAVATIVESNLFIVILLIRLKYKRSYTEHNQERYFCAKKSDTGNKRGFLILEEASFLL